jgi:hypothetical protein
MLLARFFFVLFVSFFYIAMCFLDLFFELSETYLGEPPALARTKGAFARAAVGLSASSPSGFALRWFRFYPSRSTTQAKSIFQH